MKFAYDIIKKPVITERSMEGLQDNKYTFEVAADAGKIEIKKAAEADLRRQGHEGQHH